MLEVNRHSCCAYILLVCPPCHEKDPVVHPYEWLKTFKTLRIKYVGYEKCFFLFIPMPDSFYRALVFQRLPIIDSERTDDVLNAEQAPSQILISRKIVHIYCKSDYFTWPSIYFYRLYAHKVTDTGVPQSSCRLSWCSRYPRPKSAKAVLALTVSDTARKCMYEPVLAPCSMP